MITPLCGNGMSMALQAGKIAAGQVQNFLQGTISRNEMEKKYVKNWNKLFSRRLKTGRILQRLMLNNWLISFTIGVGRIFPAIIKMMIKQTHGEPF
jgi:flavin-dependent dehydrogenase